MSERRISSGTFKLDRTRALDKLAHFQLADPVQYVAELLAAAVCAGATEVSVYNDADDFRIEWDGDHPELAELEGLFDAIFSRGTNRRARMLQHLAQGLLGALGCNPRWVRLHRPGLTVDLTRPEAPVSSENDRVEGVCVEVRERFGAAVLWEWGRRPFREPEELRRLREVAVDCPVPVRVDGKVLALASQRPDSRVEMGGDGIHGEVWLADSPATLWLHRDGIRVGELKVDTIGAHVGGMVRCDALTLDASQSSVVRDGVYDAVLDVVVAGVRELLAGRDTLSDPERRLARALIRGPDCPLAATPLFVDLAQRLWSLSQLASAPRVLMVQDAALQDASLDVPQLLGDARLRRRLTDWLGHAVEDGTDELTARAQARARRKRLRALAVPFEVAAVHTESRTVGEATRLSVGLAPEGSGFSGVRVQLFVAGLPVEHVDRRGAGPVLVRLEDPLLQADATFSTTVPPGARRRLIDTAVRAAEAAVVAAAQAHPEHPRVRPIVLDHLARSLSGRGRGAAGLPEPLRHLRLFAWSTGGRATLAEVESHARAVGRVDPRGRPQVWWVLADSSREDALTEKVLLLDKPDWALFGKLYGRRLDAVGIRLAAQAQARAEAARRRSAPAVVPHLPAGVVAQRRVSGPGWSGLLGLLPDEESSRCTVIKQGVSLGVLDLPLGVSGVVAAVSWDDVEPTADWSAPADPDHAALSLAEHLDPVALDLALETTPADLSGPLPPWLLGLLCRGPQVAGALSGRPIVRRADGTPLHLADPLPAGTSCLDVVDEDADVPAVLASRFWMASPPRRAVLSAWLGPSAVRCGRKRLEHLDRQHRRFRRAAVHPFRLPDRAVATVHHTTEDLELLLALDGRIGTRPGLHITVRHDRRDLEHLTRRDPLPWLGLVRGRAIAPGDSYRSVADKTVTRAVLAQAHEQMKAVLAALTPQDDASRHLAVRVLLALRRGPLGCALSTAERRALQARLEAAPLVRCVAGEVHTLAALQHAAASGTLGMLREAPAGTLAPAGAVWLVSRRYEDDLLRDVLGQRPPDVTEVAEARVRGRSRRAAVPQTPLLPRGAGRVAQVVLADGALAVGVAVVDGGAGVLRFRVDGRVVCSEALPELSGLQLAVEHPDLVANDAFDGVGPPERVAEVRKGALAAAGAVLSGALDDAAVVDLAVRLLAVAPDALDRDRPVLPTTDGRCVSLGELASLPRPLRLAPPGTQGRPLPGRPPVLLATPARRAALRCVGEVVDATAALSAEEAAWQRRHGPVYDTAVPEEVGCRVVLAAPRSGVVWLGSSPDDAVAVLHDGRQLTSLGPDRLDSPVWLAGHVSDPAVVPDAAFTTIASPTARRDLVAALRQAGARLLHRLLDDDTTDDGTLLAIAAQAWRGGPRALQRDTDTSARGRLARRPLLSDGEGQPWSLLALSSVPGGPRLHRHPTTCRSLDPSRPLVQVPPEHLPWLRTLLRGEDHTPTALQEHAAVLRQAAAEHDFTLGDGPFLAQVHRRRGGAEWLAGLLEDTEQQGVLELHLRGRRVGTEALPLPGLRVVMALCADRTDPLQPRPPGPVRRSLQPTYAALVAEAGIALVSGPLSLRRFCAVVDSVLPRLKKGGRPPKSSWQRPWIDLSVVATPGDRRLSVGELARALSGRGEVMWADAGAVEPAPDKTLLIVQDDVNEAIVDVLGATHKVGSLAAWREAQTEAVAVAAAERAARARARSLHKARTALQPHVRALVDDADTAARLLDGAEGSALEAATTPAARTVLAWRLADAAAVDRTAVVAVVDRLARTLSATTLGSDKP